MEFGSSDSGDDDYLGSPSAIAVHKKTDYIYVADSSTDSISVFDDDGDFLFKFDDDGSGSEFRNPSGMVIDDSEEILYVADSGKHRIMIYELTDGDNCPSGTEEVVEDEVCFVEEFGSSGSDDGEFDEPSGLAFDEDASLLYVADTENNRIQVFEIISGTTCPSGTDEVVDGVCFVEEFGSSGSGNGEFNSPMGLALDLDNDVLYVADTDNHRIQMISISGSSSDTLEYSERFGSVGDDDDEFNKPTDLAINNSDNLYIVDSNNHRIKIYELTRGDNCPSGTADVVDDEVCFDEEFGLEGSSDGRFDTPTDLAIDTDSGDIYVVDSENNRVQRFQADGDFDNLEFGSSDSGDDDYLGSPSAIAVHKKTDYIYVADSSTDSISVFDDDGNFKFNFGDTGDDDDEFRNPSGMVIDEKDDILYVADTENHRIQMFELTDDDNCPSGTDEIVNDEVCFVDSFGSKGSGFDKFDEPSGLAFDEDASLLYVADTENNRIQVFEIISGTTCPSGTDEVVDGVCFVEEFGSSGSGNGEFNSPMGLALDLDNDVLYVADTDNHRIQMLTLPEYGSSSSGSGSSSSSKEVPGAPRNISASAASPTSIVVTWEAPEMDDDVPDITGYKIEAREGSNSYTTIVGDTKSTATSYLHTGLEEGETYRYRVYAINSEGTSNPSSTASAEPGPTQTPSGLTAVAISKNQILLSWIPPTDTFKQSITGYTIEREIIPDILYEEISSVGGTTTTYTVGGLATGETYSYVVYAKLSVGNTPRSNVASATPQEDSKAPTTSAAVTVPGVPRSLNAVATSSEIQLTWKEPISDGNSKITGYKIERESPTSGGFTVLIVDTKSTTTSYIDSNVQVGSTYTYRLSAINSVGVGPTITSSEATPKKAELEISPMGQFTINEKQMLTFTVKTTESLSGVSYSLEKNPSGSSIDSRTGKFTWTPTESQGGNNYTFDVVAKKDSMTDKQSITIKVNDVKTQQPKPTQPEEPEPTQPKDEPLQIPASFVDKTKDPQYYVDRYNNEPNYKEWFDENYSEYDSIYQAVGLEEPVELAPFVDPNLDPQYYVDRYNNEPNYKEWFDENYSEYDSIYQAVGLEEPKEEPVPEPQIGECGPGTELVNGKCELTSSEGGGCLIATAAYGSELAPQVQYLREIRDGKLMNTESGASFMTGFNQVYYSFSPYIADMERENPVFKEMVKIGITPMLSTLSIMSMADSEEEILGYGIGVILMNIGMYVAAPAIVILGINKQRKKLGFNHNNS